MASVDREDCTGDSGCPRRRQEGDSISDLAWLDQAPQRRLGFQYVFMQRSIRNTAGEGRCRGKSGTDAIYSDITRAPFSCKVVCQMDNGRFGRAVGMKG